MQIQMARYQPRYDYDQENDRHVNAVDRLVHELGMPAEDVNRSYREVLEELQDEISMKPYLPVIVSMVVKERMRRQAL